MTRIIRLDPHDPLPDPGPHAIVIRRFGEDDPNAVITEIDYYGAHPAMLLAVSPDGGPVPWEDAVQAAQREAHMRGLGTVYAVDRTAGRREQDVLAHHGDHSIHSEELSDTDEEDGVSGTSLLDRPHDAGYGR